MSKSIRKKTIFRKPRVKCTSIRTEPNCGRVADHSPKRASATLRGTRPSSPCRLDPASDLRISPTSGRRTPPIRRHPFSDRVVRLVHAIVRAAVDGDGSLAPWRFGRVNLARSFKCARDLDTEVAQYRRARLCRVVVEKNIVAISPQAWLAANELPDLA